MTTPVDVGGTGGGGLGGGGMAGIDALLHSRRGRYDVLRAGFAGMANVKS